MPAKNQANQPSVARQTNHKQQRRAAQGKKARNKRAATYSFLLESLNRRTIMRRRLDDNISPIMFDHRIAIQVGASIARA